MKGDTYLVNGVKYKRVPAKVKEFAELCVGCVGLGNLRLCADLPMCVENDGSSKKHFIFTK